MSLAPLSRLLPPVTALLLFAGCAAVREVPDDPIREFPEAVHRREAPLPLPGGTRVDSIRVNVDSLQVTIHLSKEFSFQPFRTDSVKRIYSSIAHYFSGAYPGYTFSIHTLGRPIEELIPNYFRPTPAAYDQTRMPAPGIRRPEPVAYNVSRDLMPSAGLFNRTIALWHSHGWYFNNKEDRWEWQRPRLFQSVEDRVPLSVVLPYLIPMLENAGATVFVPRERDTQINEVVVDNDTPGARYLENSLHSGRGWRAGDTVGFGVGTPPYGPGQNLFAMGSFRVVDADTSSSATVTWIPEIPETGEYGVSVAYVATPGSVEDAHYTVFHAGGRTEILVNQQIGGSTWIRLGAFRFRAGINPAEGRVVLTNRSRTPGRIITADAVRFGGGMGVIERGGRTSGRPKFLEGARYYLQYAGMPDTLVYDLNRGRDDYRDDYQCRPEFTNYLNGAPSGPYRNRMVPGLGIPVDVSLAFHTDAGITRNDTTVGTLAIYSVEGADTLTSFPDGMSRYANRDLADIVQTQIVGDLRLRWDPVWNRRQLRNADYSESVRPNVPAMLLELLSHQNFLDMKFFLDPRFRFDVARAIYKGILRFVATQQRTAAAIQPLPVTHMSSTLAGTDSVVLRWRPQPDPLEPSARPERYKLYTRVEDGGFDNGVIVHDTTVTLGGLKAGIRYSYRVTGINAGGESFPSEILSVCHVSGSGTPALIVNGFDRLSGPGTVEVPGYAGFLGDGDRGVADGKDFALVGRQHDFDPGSVFRTNDAPGHGASSADEETQLFAGNSFDYPFVHGTALRSCGFSYASCSDEAIMDSTTRLDGYRFVDYILGKERTTHWQRPALDSSRGVQFEAFPVGFRVALSRLTAAGGALFVSGAYVGSDLFSPTVPDTTAPLFGRKVLHFTWVAGQAARRGEVMCVDSAFLPRWSRLSFATEPSAEVYPVESPDAIGPVDGGKTLLRYVENEFGAAVGYRGTYGVVVAGFPFETVKGEESRATLMGAITRWLGVGR